MAKKPEKKHTGKNAEIDTAQENAENDMDKCTGAMMCPDCDFVLDSNGDCDTHECAGNPATHTENDDTDHTSTPRYRATLEKALKRLPCQIANVIEADMDVILRQFSNLKPNKLTIPIYGYLTWDGENMTLESCLQVKRSPLKFDHGSETINIDAVLPGMETEVE